MNISLRRTLTGLVVSAGLASSLLAVVSPAQASTQGSTIARSEILGRAQHWVTQGITYTQAHYAGDVDGHHTYRRDCSGLVAMAWHYGSSPLTNDFLSMAQNNNGMHVISRDDLRAGDAIVRDSDGAGPDGHMELFSHWVNASDHSQGAYVYSFNDNGETVQNPYAVNNYNYLGKNSNSEMSGYTAIRYNKVARQVYEASSASGWASPPINGGSGYVQGSTVASLYLGGAKFVYTVIDGKVYEASSANNWINQPTGITGVSDVALAAITINSTKFIYTIANGQVYEASSDNRWINQPTGIKGVSQGSLAAINHGGTKFVYTVIDGKVREASSGNGWANLDTGIGTNGSAIGATSFGSAKLVYSMTNGSVFEASSATGWANQNTWISGISPSTLSVIAIDTTKFIYTIANGQVYEASSDNRWANLNTGVPGSVVGALKVGTNKIFYTI